MRVFLKKNYSFCLKLCFLHVISIFSSVGTVYECLSYNDLFVKNNPWMDLDNICALAFSKTFHKFDLREVDKRDFQKIFKNLVPFNIF